MSFARGFARGFLKQGLEEKAARDQAHAEMVKEIGTEFKKTSKLFRQEQKDIEDRFNIVDRKHGTPAALYASYSGLLDTVDGTNLVINGITGLFAPEPEPFGGDEGDPQDQSYNFTGLLNNTKQGVPINIVYGETLIGTNTVSANIDTLQVVNQS